MSNTVTFVVRPGEDIRNVNARLRNFYAADYERGTLEVHPQRQTHHVSLALKSQEISYITVPGSRQTWADNYFPDVVKFITDRPLKSFGFPTDNFTINGQSIPSTNVVVNDDYTFSVYLTGDPSTGIASGNNTLALTEYVYGEGGDKFKGVLWDGDLVEDVVPRKGRDEFYARKGGRLKVAKITLHKTSTAQKELNKLRRRKRTEILDVVHIPTSDAASISGWLYVVYADRQNFEIEYIDPSRDAVVEGVDTEINIKFTQPVDPQYKDSFDGRIFTTNYQDSTLVVAESVVWANTNDYITVTPAASTRTEGLHQLYIDMSNVFSAEGQKFSGPINYVWSSYYLKNLNLVKSLNDLSDVDLTTPPTNGQSLAWDQSSSSWVPTTITGGPGGGTGGGINEQDFWDLSGDFTGHTGETGTHYTMDDIFISQNQIVDLDLTPYVNQDSFWTLSGDFTGHTGETGIHYTMDEIFITESQITDLKTYATQTSFDLLEDKFNTHSGDTGVHFTMGDIFITESQIADLSSTDVSGLSGDFTGHTGETGIHFDMSDIFITESQITDLGTYATEADLTTLKTIVDAHTGVGGGTGQHFTMDEIFISESQITDLSHTDVSGLSGDFTGHTGNTGTHFEMSDIFITESQITDLSHTDISGLSGDFTGHTGTTGTHFEMADIFVTESQISDFGTYATAADLDTLEAIVDAHTGIGGGTGQHFTMDQIFITESQIIDLSHTDVSGLSGDLTGHTGETGVHFSMSDIFITESQITDLSHTDVSGLSGDFTGHTGETGTHFTMGSIFINESQITDLKTYALETEFAILKDDFDTHTGNTGVHFNMSEIFVTESQISDLADYALDSDLNALSSDYHGHINGSWSYDHQEIDAHIDNVSNPHQVTIEQVSGLPSGVLTGISFITNTDETDTFPASSYLQFDSSFNTQITVGGNYGVGLDYPTIWTNATYTGLTGGSFITINDEPGVSNSRRINAGSYLSVTDNGVGNTYDINVNTSALADVFARSGDLNNLATPQYLCVSTDANLVNERQILFGKGFSITDNGAGNQYIVNTRPSQPAQITLSIETPVATDTLNGIFVSGATTGSAGVMSASTFSAISSFTGDGDDPAEVGSGLTAAYRYNPILQLNSGGTNYGSFDVIGGQFATDRQRWFTWDGVQIASIELASSLGFYVYSGDIGITLGDLTLLAGNINMAASATVDGVDVSDLDTNFSTHITDVDQHPEYLLGDGSRAMSGSLDMNSQGVNRVRHITNNSFLTNSNLIVELSDSSTNKGAVIGDAFVGNYPVGGVVTFGYAGIATGSLNNYAVAHTAGGLTAISCSVGSSVNVVEAGGGAVGGTDIAAFSTGSGFISIYDITAEQDLDVKGNIANSGSYNGFKVERGMPTIMSLWNWRQAALSAGTAHRFWDGSSDVSNGLPIPENKILHIQRAYGVVRAGATVGTYEYTFGVATRTISGGGGSEFPLVTTGSISQNGYAMIHDNSNDSDAPLASITGSATTTLLCYLSGNASNPAATASYKHRLYIEGWWEDI